jgi:uncharacterized protein (DUF433 family)
MSFPGVTIDPQQRGGAPCIRGRRIPVITVVNMVEAGISRDTILEWYPSLEAEDIDEALRFHLDPH